VPIAIFLIDWSPEIIQNWSN